MCQLRFQLNFIVFDFYHTEQDKAGHMIEMSSELFHGEAELTADLAGWFFHVAIVASQECADIAVEMLLGDIL